MGKIVEFPREAIVDTLIELAFPVANKWPNEKLSAKCANLREIVDEDGVDLESDVAVDTFNKLMETLESGDTIKVVDEVGEVEAEAPEETEPEPKPKPAPKAPAGKKPKAPTEEAKPEKENKPVSSKKKVAKKVSKKVSKKTAKKVVKKVTKKTAKKVSKKVTKKTAKKVSKKVSKKTAKKVSKKVSKKTAKKPGKKIGLDKFGNRLGSLAAKWNAALTNKPLTGEQLVKKTDDRWVRYNHLNTLIEKGFAKRTDKGYVLA